MAKIQEYKCPCCGGQMSFDSSIQKVKCPYCDTEFEMESLREYDTSLSEKQDNMGWEYQAGSDWNGNESDGLRQYICKSCGGEIIGDENTAATSCPYCGNPIVVMDKVAGILKPDFVIPFKLDKEKAKEALFSHMKGKRLLPKVFKDENHIDEIRGIYVPFWFYDSDVKANLSFKGTKTRVWEDKNNVYTETSYFGINRGGTIRFENVPADGSSKMDDTLMESLEPFNMNEAVDFQTAYLAGYLADKYDVSSDDCLGRVNSRIKASTERAFEGTVNGYAQLTLESSSVDLENSKIKYGLCPVWLLNTNWKGEKYTFAMNGQTGKFVGNLPMDKGLFVKWFATISGGVAAATFAVQAIVELLQGGAL